jgi:hypothetical protein
VAREAKLMLPKRATCAAWIYIKNRIADYAAAPINAQSLQPFLEAIAALR